MTLAASLRFAFLPSFPAPAVRRTILARGQAAIACSQRRCFQNPFIMCRSRGDARCVHAPQSLRPPASVPGDTCDHRTHCLHSKLHCLVQFHVQLVFYRTPTCVAPPELSVPASTAASGAAAAALLQSSDKPDFPIILPNLSPWHLCARRFRQLHRL
jgi:hypothetical protein